MPLSPVLEINIDGKAVAINISYTTNKNLYLKLKNGNLHLLVPKKIPDKKALDWLNEILPSFLKRVDAKNNHIYFSLQEKFVFLFGRKIFYVIKESDEIETLYKNGVLHIYCHNSQLDQTETFLQNFVTEQLNAYLNNVVPKYEKILGTREHLVSSSNKESAWGTNFLDKNKLIFATKLGHYSKTVIDYVIIHELVHDKFANHSSDFWNEVEKYCPNYKKSQEMLKKDIELGAE